MLRRLARDGWVVQRPYRGVFLTPEGEALAHAGRQRHQTVERFLLALGVDADTARRDAEGIEHHVSEQTLALFEAFVRRPRAAEQTADAGPRTAGGWKCGVGREVGVRALSLEGIRPRRPIVSRGGMRRACGRRR